MELSVPDKYRVTITKGMWQDQWPEYFDKFYHHCSRISSDNGWELDTVINYQLKPHGKLIKTNTQGWYLRWDDEKYHTAFVLRWA